MPIDRLRRIALAALVCCLTGCATADGKGLSLSPKDNFGEATKQTFAAQIINPNPDYADQVPATSGSLVAAAIERYRTGRVKQPVSQRTSQVGVQTGGSSGTASGSGN